MELHLSSRSQCKTHLESPARHPGVQLSASTAPAVVPNMDSPVSPVPAAHGDPLPTRSRSARQPQRVPPCTRRAGTEKSPLPRSEREGRKRAFSFGTSLGICPSSSLHSTDRFSSLPPLAVLRASSQLQQLLQPPQPNFGHLPPSPRSPSSAVPPSAASPSRILLKAAGSSPSPKQPTAEDAGWQSTANSSHREEEEEKRGRARRWESSPFFFPPRLPTSAPASTQKAPRSRRARERKTNPAARVCAQRLPARRRGCSSILGGGCATPPPKK